MKPSGSSRPKRMHCDDGERAGAGREARAPSPLSTGTPARLHPVRTVFCSSGGAIGAAVLGRLLACEQMRIAGVIESSRILRADYHPVRGACEQIRRSGLPYALYLWIATTLADTLLTLSGKRSLNSLARGRRIARLVTRNINGERERGWLRQIAPDLLVSAFFNQRVGPAVLALPRLGAVNIHPSLLPDFRGVDPVFFARLRSAERLGVSVHWIDLDFDTGNVLATEELPPIASESVFAGNLRLFRRGADLLIRDLDGIAQGTPGTPQPDGGRYDSWPTPGEAARLRRHRIPLVRWTDLRALITG